ncbi:hypothetical protein SAMN06265350_11229 [Solitalea koreensis]|uniref:Uncharacterized protein n=2 Tax=Solitalea koreensis TaxID=543615 RepID=A0A521E7L8_9SPHI|nr:hypothetical protein SAMN06265350_11229 [Solitalea koreensis]
MVLSVTPCCAWDHCDSEDTVTTIKGNDKKSHTNDETGKGTCSPFFACSSCSGFVTNAAVSIIIELPSINPVPLLVKYINHYSLQRSNPIWQPPQLS